MLVTSYCVLKLPNRPFLKHISSGETGWETELNRIVNLHSRGTSVKLMESRIDLVPHVHMMYL